MSRKNNTSGYVGVTYDIHFNKWKAHIRIANRRYHLGYFQNIEEAIQARKEAEKISKFGVLSNGQYGNILFFARQRNIDYDTALTAAIKAILSIEGSPHKYISTTIYKAIMNYEGEADLQLNKDFVESIRKTTFEKWFAGSSLRKLTIETGHHLSTLSTYFYMELGKLQEELLKNE